MTFSWVNQSEMIGLMNDDQLHPNSIPENFFFRAFAQDS